MFHHYNLKESDIFIFDQFLIIQIKEGVLVNMPHEEELNDIIQKHFKGKDMVYISNRVNSYAVNPLIYPETEKILNLVAIAIVPKTQKMRSNAEFERKFYNKPYGVFDTLSLAIEWVHTVIDKNYEP
ncbi:hypothetical protein LX97_03465 [Nonlabens dokdonensis]|jgi:hypothetical protein|nr:hypothetical protein [Nonlabens dokdonensis]PZX36254.1 hypothetical protein LX97_03465 [Nonlabens dokdonensis]